MARVWTILAVPPIVFLFIIVGASIYFGVRTDGDGQTIGNNVTRSTPYILLLVQIIVLFILLSVLRSDNASLRNIGWQAPAGGTLWREGAIGGVVGLILGVLYLSVLSPFLVAAQQRFGDYVPPGEMLPALGAAVIPFFLANVVFAPFVEESIYRGYALSRLLPEFGIPGAVLISCIFFGLLHWAGGFWYIMLTGIVAGGVFSGLFVWRGSIIAPFAAHLTLNSIEFLYVWLKISR